MLKIYSVVLEVVKGVRPVIEQLDRKDPDLARQMRRAASSVALNLQPGTLRSHPRPRLRPRLRPHPRLRLRPRL